jgi:acyl carrier protein
MSPSTEPSAKSIIRHAILQAFAEALELRRLKALKELTDNTILLESGLDSLGFAILVVKLEESLGYDPFVLMNEPVYPTTMGEFIDIYERYFPVAG